MHNVAAYYIHIHDLDKAYRLYKQILEIDESSNNLHGTAVVNLNLGNILEQKSDMSGALERYRTAHRIFRELDEKDSVIKCLNMIGLVNFGLGNLEDARNDFQTALDLAVKIGDKSQEALMLGNLGAIDAQSWNLDQAFEKFTQSLEIARSTGDTNQQMLMSINIGDVQLFHGDLNQAVTTHARAVELARKINDPFNEALAHRSLAWDHYYLANFRASLDEFGSSKDLYQGIGDRRDAVISSIGGLMVQSRLAPVERKAGELAGIEAKARERNDAEILSLVLDIKLAQCVSGQDYTAAKTTADELIEQAKKTGQKRLYAWTLSKMAQIQADQENIEAARITLDKAGRLAQALGDRLLEIECRLVSALIHEKTAEPAAYRDDLAAALDLSRETGARDYEARILRRLIKSGKKDSKESEGFREKYIKTIEEITRGLTAEEKIHYLKTLEK
jgi:tetratricopeptide (TPR) repeat protein